MTVTGLPASTEEVGGTGVGREVPQVPSTEDEGGNCSPGRVGTIRIGDVLLDAEAGFTAVEKVVHDGEIEEADTGRTVVPASELVLVQEEGDCT